jgi:hypothetical protein
MNHTPPILDRVPSGRISRLWMMKGPDDDGVGVCARMYSNPARKAFSSLGLELAVGSVSVCGKLGKGGG